MEINSSSDRKPVLSDQIMAVRKQLPIILLLYLPLVLALAWIYWPWVNHFALIAWSALMLLLMIGRLVMFVGYGNYLWANQSLRSNERTLTINSMISGLMWGWAGILFFVPDKLDYQLIILVVLIAKGAGSVSSIVNSLPAFYAYLPLSMLPVSTMFLIQGNITSALLGAIALFFTILVLVFGRNLNHTLKESLHIRYENQQLLEETEQRKQQAETANQAKSRFLAAASHDLRQPIHALSLLMTVLESRNLAPESGEILDRMRLTIESLQKLLDALLDISRLDAGTVTVQKESVNFLDVCARLAPEFEVMTDDKPLTLIWPQQPVSIDTDRILMEQILRNLLTNAIRYTPSGTIEVKCVAHDSRVRIEIHDTGIGISADQQQAIFTEFFQVSNQQRDRSQGLGLGLAIVDRIIKLLNSHIELTSAPNHGSCFAFELPAGKPLPAQQKNTSSKHAFEGKQADGCIAVLEDDQDVMEAMRLMLESWNLKPVLAGNSDELLQQLPPDKIVPQVIISDLQLAENRNGIDEVNRLRNIYHNDIPALIVTGNIQAEQQQAIRQSGLQLLYKPVAPAKLRSFIRNQLNTKTHTKV